MKLKIDDILYLKGEYLCVNDNINNVTYYFFKNLRYKITSDLPFFPKKSWSVELIDVNNNLFLSSYSPYYKRYMYALSDECIIKNFNTIKQLRKLKLEKLKKLNEF